MVSTIRDNVYRRLHSKVEEYFCLASLYEKGQIPWNEYCERMDKLLAIINELTDLHTEILELQKGE